MLNANKLNRWVLKKSFSVFLVKILGAVIAFFLNVYIARTLGAEQFGVYSYVFSWIVILSLFSNFGFEHLQARQVSALNAKEQFIELKTLISSGYLFVFSLGLLICILIYFILYALNDYFSDSISSTFYLGTMLIPVLALASSNKGILRGLKKQLQVSSTFEVIRPLILLCFVFLASQLFTEITASNIMGLLLLSFISALAISFFLVSSYQHKLPSGTSQYQPLKDKYFTSLEWGKLAIPFLLYTGVMQIDKNIDILMLGSLADMESAGLYAVVTRVITMMLLITVTLNTVASPIFSELYTLKKLKELQKVVSIVAKVSSLIAIFTAILIYFYGEYILGLFGIKFTEGSDSLKVLTFAQLIKTLSGPILMLSVMIGQQKLALKIIGIGVIIKIFLNLVLIPQFGIIGAAISSFVSIIFWSMLLAYFLYQKVGINPTVFSRL